MDYLPLRDLSILPTTEMDLFVKKEKEKLKLQVTVKNMEAYLSYSQPQIQHVPMIIFLLPY